METEGKNQNPVLYIQPNTNSSTPVSLCCLFTCSYHSASAASTHVDFKNRGAKQKRPCTLVRMWHKRIIDPASCLFLWVYFTCILLRTKFFHWKSWCFCHLSLWSPTGWFLLIRHHENARMAHFDFEDSNGTKKGIINVERWLYISFSFNRSLCFFF